MLELSNVRAIRTPLALTLAAAIAVGTTGCADMSQRQQDTGKGAAIGAAAGALLGALGGDATKGAVFGAVAGAVAGNVWSKKMEDKRHAMEQATQGTGVSVTKTEDNQLKVNVPSDISFDSGKAALKPELHAVLDKFAQGLDATMLVHVVGHTDSQGSDALNDPLSRERAESVRHYLIGRGVQATHIDTEGRGERQPIADNSTAEGRARNRRVEILLREPQPAAPAQKG